MADDNFKKELDELFHLFKKVVEKRDMNDIPGMDKFMLQQFQFFFGNYDQMKDQIADQLEGQFGESVKDMIHTLILQLREEVDEDIIPAKEEEKPVVSIEQVGSDIAEIDKMLKNSGLTEEQVNELLDRRANLTSI